MKVVRFRLLAVVGCAALMGSLCPMASAGTILDGWNYAVDSQADGSGAAYGFEMRGLAFRQVGSTAYFAVSGGLPLGGTAWGGTLNNNIAYGDLYLNFSTHNLDTPGEFTDANVLGIRFDAANDSLSNVGGSNPTLGVFANITPVGLALQNSGYGSLQQYYNHGFGAASGAMGDLSSTSNVIDYLGNGAMMTNIGSGTKIGDISLLDRGALSGLGLNFGQLGADPLGNSVFGFSFDSGLLPVGGFMSHLFYECINDGTALLAVTNPGPHTTSTPEPSSIVLLGTGLATLVGWRSRRRKPI